MGYGARALQALNTYYSGEYFNLDEFSKPEVSYVDATVIDEVCQNIPPFPSREISPKISPLPFSPTILPSDLPLQCLLSCNASRNVNRRISITSAFRMG
jgi:hypothetical protein